MFAAGHVRIVLLGVAEVDVVEDDIMESMVVELLAVVLGYSIDVLAIELVLMPFVPKELVLYAVPDADATVELAVD